MDKIAELHDFCLAWQMESDTVDTMKEWFFGFEMSYDEFAKVVKNLGWYVSSMDQIKEWSK